MMQPCKKFGLKSLQQLPKAKAACEITLLLLTCCVWQLILALLLSCFLIWGDVQVLVYWVLVKDIYHLSSLLRGCSGCFCHLHGAEKVYK